MISLHAELLARFTEATEPSLRLVVDVLLHFTIVIFLRRCQTCCDVSGIR